MKITGTSQRSKEAPDADKLAAEIVHATTDLKAAATRVHDTLGDHKVVICHWGGRWDHLNTELPETIEKLKAFAEASGKFADFVDMAAADLYKLSNGWKEDFAALIGLEQIFFPHTQNGVDALQQSYMMEYENAKKVSETLRGLSFKATSLSYYLNQLQMNLQKLPADQRERSTRIIPLVRSVFKHLFEGCEIFEKCTPPTVYSESFFMATAAESFDVSVRSLGEILSASLIR